MRLNTWLTTAVLVAITLLARPARAEAPDALALVERALEAHGPAPLKIGFEYRGDVIDARQGFAVAPPFERYAFTVTARLDEATQSLDFLADTSIAGGFTFPVEARLREGKGTAVDPIAKTYTEWSTVPGTLNRVLPQRVLRQMTATPAALSYEGGDAREHRVRFAPPDAPGFTAHFDRESGLLLATSWERPQGAFGDGTQLNRFGDYRRVGTWQLPGRLEVVVRNSVHDEIVNRFSFTAYTTAPAFDAPERMRPAGYEAFVPVVRGNAQLHDLGNGAYWIENVTNTDQQWSTNVMFVVFPSFVLVTEAPGGDDITHLVLGKIRDVAPGKPVRYLVQSHHHEDHIAGLRGYVAEGSTVLVGAPIKEWVTRMVTAPYALKPDRLAREPRALSLETVEGRRVIREGDQEVVVIDIPSPHAPTMLVTWVPRAGVMFQADLVNEGEFGEDVATTRDFLERLPGLKLPVKTLIGLHGRPRALQP